MAHFVSKSCAGEKCVCGRAATHKLGEEIAPDEPCMLCGETRQYPDTVCGNTIYHCGGGPNRHNLTSYVCCFHWSLILGPAAGCPLDENDARTLAEFRRACTDDGDVFAPTIELRCVACRGPLEVEGSNSTNVMIGCTACGIGHHVMNKEA